MIVDDSSNKKANILIAAHADLEKGHICKITIFSFISLYIWASSRNVRLGKAQNGLLSYTDKLKFNLKVAGLAITLSREQLNLKAPRKKVHLKMSSAEGVCCK